MGQRAPICLNCGDNRATNNGVTCDNCTEDMFMGGYKGDGL